LPPRRYEWEQRAGWINFSVLRLGKKGAVAGSLLAFAARELPVVFAPTELAHGRKSWFLREVAHPALQVRAAGSLSPPHSPRLSPPLTPALQVRHGACVRALDA
jgi:hypothetical protein